MDVDLAAFSGVLDRLAETDATFKCQHKDEPDLTLGEKRAIASEVLSRDVGAFLYRFGGYLPVEDLALFEAHRTDYAVDCYFTQRVSRSRKKAAVVRNRRLAAVEDMMEQGEYFSELEMKKRDPGLYEDMVGRYMTEEEKLALENQVVTSREDQKLSSILGDHFVLDQRRQNSAFRENVDDEEEEDVSEEEKHQLREEFRDIMVERFLAGEDEDFDYRDVDENPRYKDDTIENQDAEDSYFDAEMPEDHVLDE